MRKEEEVLEVQGAGRRCEKYHLEEKSEWAREMDGGCQEHRAPWEIHARDSKGSSQHSLGAGTG